MKTANILIIDNYNSCNYSLNELINSMNHKTFQADDCSSAMGILENESIDLILLDIEVSLKNNFNTLRSMKTDKNFLHIPVIVLTDNDKLSYVIESIENGADDYITRPFEKVITRTRVESSLRKKHMYDLELNYKKEIEEQKKRLEQRVKDQVQEITFAQLSSIFAMAKLSESRDPETGEHLERMREYCKILCRELKKTEKYKDVITDDFTENIYAASPLHDIGKVGVPDRILQKPDKLTKEEFDLMKKHPCIGAETLREVDERHPGNNFVSMGIEIAESHHEKWNGKGYPNGLSGENIPLAGRIIALGDVYDALTSKRCYKDAFSHEKSMEIIISGTGEHFDPDVVKAFINIEEKFRSIREKYQDSKKDIII